MLKVGRNKQKGYCETNFTTVDYDFVRIDENSKNLVDNVDYNSNNLGLDTEKKLNESTTKTYSIPAAIIRPKQYVTINYFITILVILVTIVLFILMEILVILDSAF